MKKILSFTIFLFVCLSSYACLNEYHVNRNGKGSMDYFTMSNVSFLRGFDTMQLNKELKELQADKDGDYLKIQNNIAVKLIKLGRLEEALTILQTLYKGHPQEYNVLINTGTLYELMGKNELALNWIRSAMKINPQSHDGSEWFHVRVLEAKINNNDINALTTQKILNLDSLKIQPHLVIKNVVDQLQERIPFTPIPNLAMANMLNEFGDYLADSISISGAYVIYNMAMEYYPEKDVFNITPKLEEMKRLIKKYKAKQPYYKNYFVSMDEYYRKKRNGERFDSFLNKAMEIRSKL